MCKQGAYVTYSISLPGPVLTTVKGQQQLEAVPKQSSCGPSTSSSIVAVVILAVVIVAAAAAEVIVALK